MPGLRGQGVFAGGPVQGADVAPHRLQRCVNVELQQQPPRRSFVFELLPALCVEPVRAALDIRRGLNTFHFDRTLDGAGVTTELVATVDRPARRYGTALVCFNALVEFVPGVPVLFGHLFGVELGHGGDEDRLQCRFGERAHVQRRVRRLRPAAGTCSRRESACSSWYSPITLPSPSWSKSQKNSSSPSRGSAMSASGLILATDYILDERRLGRTADDKKDR